MFIPLRIRLLHNFGRTSFNMGFLFSLIGLTFIIYFSSTINWQVILAADEDFVSSSAFITDVNETRYSVNDNYLFEYQYRYRDNEENVNFGTFLEYENAFQNGDKIQIEYLAKSPEISRFSGKDRRNLDQIMLLAGVAGSLVGIFFLVPSVRKTRKERKILAAGKPVKGKLIHAEPTAMSINEQTVYKLTFEFPTGRNQTQQFSTRSHLIRNLSEEHFEALVYDPRQPENAVIIDTLPGPVARYISAKIDSFLN